MRTQFSKVYDKFLSKTTTYEYLNLTEEEIALELFNLLETALAQFITIKTVSLNEVMEEFSRELTLLEIDILSSLMVISWISPKINNVELFKNQLASKDFQQFSNANLLKEMISVKESESKNAHYWMSRYDWNNNLSVLKGGDI